MERVKNGLKILLLSALCALSVGAGWVGWKMYGRVERILQRVEGIGEKIDRLAGDTGELVSLYKVELESEKSKKALSASLAAAASWQATARLVNTEIVPEFRETLRGVQATNGELGRLIREQNRELSLTQGQTREAIASLQGQVEGIGPEIGRLTTTAAETATAGGRTLAELERSSNQMTEILRNLSLASESAPEIAGSLEKIVKSGQKFQRPLSILTLLIALLGAVR